MHYSQIVYDFADRQPSYFVMLFPLIFVVMSMGAFLFYRYGMKSPATMVIDPRKRTIGMYVYAALTLFTAIVSSGMIYQTIHSYDVTKTVYESGQYRIAEGIVEQYHPMPIEGHDTERFTVQDVQFVFSPNDPMYGYNTPASHGGAIRSGAHVRISYFHDGIDNVILKLEME